MWLEDRDKQLESIRYARDAGREIELIALRLKLGDRAFELRLRHKAFAESNMYDMLTDEQVDTILAKPAKKEWAGEC